MTRLRNQKRVFLWLFLSLFIVPAAHAADAWVPITNFTAGELSPLMDARFDMSKYLSGCATLENMVVHRQGPATKRPGFRFIAETKNSARASRLIPFEYSTEQAYVLEFGESGAAGYIRFYMDQGQILSGASPYEIASNYLEDDLADLRCCQSADVMYLVHPDHPIRKLERFGHTNWTLTDVTITGSSTLNTGAGAYPKACTFHENRLAFAGSNNKPNTLWLSKTGSFENFTVGTADDDAIEVSLASDQVNAVQWLVSARYLTIGTTSGVWRLSATSADDPITPTDITAKRELSYGSDSIAPVHVGNDILFVQRHRLKIRKLAYNWESDGYVAPDMTVLSEDITESGVSEIAYQQEPFSVLWAVRVDGELAGLTYLPEHDVFAWHRQVTEGDFESIAVVPGESQDDLYAVVERTIDGAEKRYVEVMASPFTGDDVADAFLVDSGISYDEEVATTTFVGADHLANTEVIILADGEVISGVTVDAGGGVTIPAAASTVHLGLPYTGTLKTMRLEMPAAEGAIQGRVKRISHAIVRLLRTWSFSIGPDEESLLEVDNASLYTGDKKVGLRGGYNTDGYLCIKQEDPLPMTIMGINARVEMGD